MVCVDCHEVHGSTQEQLLKGSILKDTCTRCHMEKQGPFAFEHADLTENCHELPHPARLGEQPPLNAAMPFLCLQCHTGHLEHHPGGEAALHEPLHGLPLADPRQRHPLPGTSPAGARCASDR